jgi:hypothetical protein
MTDSELIVDLRGRRVETLDDFWDAVSEPCGLPELFGRNLDVSEDSSTGTGRRPMSWPASLTENKTSSSSTGRPDESFGRLARRRLQMRTAARWSAAR